MVNLIRSIIGLLGVFVAVGIAVGAIGVNVNPIIAGMVLVGFAALTYGVSQGDEFSVTFGLTLGAGTVILMQFLPEAIRVRLPMGEAVQGIDPLTIAVLTLLVVFFWWIIDIRFLSTRAKKPETVAKRLRDRFLKLVDAYASMGRVAIAGAAIAVVIIVTQLGGAGAEIFAEAPWLVADLLTAVLGYLAASGTPISIPFVGDVSISAGVFAILAIGLILAAGAADFDT